MHAWPFSCVCEMQSKCQTHTRPPHTTTTTHHVHHTPRPPHSTHTPHITSTPHTTPTFCRLLGMCASLLSGATPGSFPPSVLPIVNAYSSQESLRSQGDTRPGTPFSHSATKLRSVVTSPAWLVGWGVCEGYPWGDTGHVLVSTTTHPPLYTNYQDTPNPTAPP